MDYLLPILLTLMASLPGVYAIYAAKRREVARLEFDKDKKEQGAKIANADRERNLATTALDYVDQMEERMGRIEAKNRQLENTVMLQDESIKAQDSAIERLNDFYKKLETAFVILYEQIMAEGGDPIVSLDDLVHLTYKDVLELHKKLKGLIKNGKEKT